MRRARPSVSVGWVLGRTPPPESSSNGVGILASSPGLHSRLGVSPRPSSLNNVAGSAPMAKFQHISHTLLEDWNQMKYTAYFSRCIRERAQKGERLIVICSFCVKLPLPCSSSS